MGFFVVEIAFRKWMATFGPSPAAAAMAKSLMSLPLVKHAAGAGQQHDADGGIGLRGGDGLDQPGIARAVERVLGLRPVHGDLHDAVRGGLAQHALAHSSPSLCWSRGLHGALREGSSEAGLTGGGAAFL